MKKAFTMIELIFVIAILGVLAMVAIPRLVGSKEDAEITRVRAEIAAIRSSIQTYRGANLLKQQKGSGYPDALDEATIEKITNGTKLSKKYWEVDQKGNTLAVKIAGQKTTFTYNKDKGILTCSDSEPLCVKIEN